MNFEIGDVVQLKSGGPFTIVTEIHDDFIECTYWDKCGSGPDIISFHPAMLRKVKTENNVDIEKIDKLQSEINETLSEIEKISKKIMGFKEWT